jgi:hypothetical protein
MLGRASGEGDGDGVAATGEHGAEHAPGGIAPHLVFGSCVTLRLSSAAPRVLVCNGFADNTLALRDGGGGGDRLGASDQASHDAQLLQGIPMRDCVFEVMFPLEYSAAAALASACIRKDALDAPTLARMRAASVAEHRSNEDSARQNHGRPVMFGQRLQLRHVSSNKFVTVRPRVLSKVCELVETRACSLCLCTCAGLCFCDTLHRRSDTVVQWSWTHSGTCFPSSSFCLVR